MGHIFTGPDFAPRKRKPAAEPIRRQQLVDTSVYAGLVAAAGLVLREAQRTDTETCLSQRAHKTLNDAYAAAGGIL